MNQVKILWTNHAILRQKEWEKSLGITREEVENLVRGGKGADRVFWWTISLLTALCMALYFKH